MVTPMRGFRLSDDLMEVLAGELAARNDCKSESDVLRAFVAEACIARMRKMRIAEFFLRDLSVDAVISYYAHLLIAVEGKDQAFKLVDVPDSGFWKANNITGRAVLDQFSEFTDNGIASNIAKKIAKLDAQIAVDLANLKDEE